MEGASNRKARSLTPPIRKEWRPKVQSQIHWPATTANIVFALPRDFKGYVLEANEVQNEESAISGKATPIVCYVFDDILDDMDDEGKLGHEFMSTDELQEIRLCHADKPMPTYINKKQSQEFKVGLTKLLKEYQDFFAWEYHEMSGLNQSIVKIGCRLNHNIDPTN
jgi:hypothetical protein